MIRFGKIKRQHTVAAREQKASLAGHLSAAEAWAIARRWAGPNALVTPELEASVIRLQTEAYCG